MLTIQGVKLKNRDSRRNKSKEQIPTSVLFKTYGLILYWVVLILDCYFIYNKSYNLRLYVRPFLIPILFVHFYLKVSKSHSIQTRNLILVAFFFIWSGDLMAIRTDGVLQYWAILLYMMSNLIYAFVFYRIAPLKYKILRLPIVVSFISMILIYVLFKLIRINDLILLDKIIFYLYAFVLVILFSVVVNTLNYEKRKKMALLHFIPGIFLLIIANCSQLIIQVKTSMRIDLLITLIAFSFGYSQLIMTNGFRKYLV